MSTVRPAGDAKGTAVRILLLAVALGSVQHYRNDVHPANEASRVYAALALVDHGTVVLDPVFDDLVPGWRTSGRPPNEDVARRDGSYLLDKAPGVSLLAVPVVAAIRAFGGRPSFATLTWVLALLLSALPSAGFAGVLARRLRRDGLAGADLVAAGIVLATPWLAYGGMLFGHALSTSLAGIGLLLVLGPVRSPTGGAAPADRSPGAGRGGAVAGGLLLGLAVLTEYPVALLAVLACGALLADRPRRRLLPWVLLGAVPAIAALVAWNVACFGSPFALSYGFKDAPAFQAIHSQGVYGMSAPSADHLFGILLGSRRGLLFLAPWLLAGFAGAVAAAGDRRVATPWRIALAVALPAWCLWISGFADWTAGSSVGPRHLLPGLPLLAVGTAVAWAGLSQRRHGRMALAALASLAGLVLTGFVVNATMAWTFPYADPAVTNPLAEIAMPVLLEAGPAPTAWDGTLPRPSGACLALAAALVVLGLALAAARRGAAGPRDPSAAAAAPGTSRRDALGASLAFVVALVLHLAGLTLPETPPEGTRRVLQNRAWAFEMTGHEDLSAALRADIDRATRP